MVSSEPRASVCPPVVQYNRETQERAALEVEGLPEGAAITGMLSDYAVLRDQASMQMKSGPGESLTGSAERLDRGASPGPVHGFTLSTNGRDSLLLDYGRRSDACPARTWAQLCT